MGPIWVRTPALMRGYLGRDDLTAEVVRGGWLGTGDIGCLDAAGRLHLRGRERDEINRGGMKVYPADIEAVLEQFDGALDTLRVRVRRAARAKRRWRWPSCCAPPMSPPCAGSTRGCVARLAGYQLPRRWFLVDEIPRTSVGKSRRSEVAARCAGLRAVDPRDLAGDQGGGPVEG